MQTHCDLNDEQISLEIFIDSSKLNGKRNGKSCLIAFNM